MNRLPVFLRTVVPSAYEPAPSLRCYCSPSPSAPAPANKNLFVASLSWSVDERSLLDAFSKFGELTRVRIIYDKDTGRSRGFGFVYFVKEEDAKTAIGAMDGKALLGRPMRISFAIDWIRRAPIVVPHIQSSEDAGRPKN